MDAGDSKSFTTAESLMSCGWENVLRGLNEQGYMAMEDGFRDASTVAFEQDRTTDGGALRLLAELCAMMLSVSDARIPFGPEWVFRGGRSRIPDDLLPAEVASLAEFVPQVENPWLKGRIAHVVWIASKPRDVRYALMTIDCYRSLPLTVSAWLHGGHAAWAQAIMLSKSLRGAVGNRLQAIERDLVETALSSELGQMFRFFRSHASLGNTDSASPALGTSQPCSPHVHRTLPRRASTPTRLLTSSRRASGTAPPAIGPPKSRWWPPRLNRTSRRVNSVSGPSSHRLLSLPHGSATRSRPIARFRAPSEPRLASMSGFMNCACCCRKRGVSP